MLRAINTSHTDKQWQKLLKLKRTLSLYLFPPLSTDLPILALAICNWVEYTIVHDNFNLIN